MTRIADKLLNVAIAVWPGLVFVGLVIAAALAIASLRRASRWINDLHNPTPRREEKP